MVSRGWHVRLGDAVLRGSSEDGTRTEPAGGVVVGYLGKPPKGLGVPGLRTEDAIYPQRDGTQHFDDWYESRIITLEEVTIGGDGCDCHSAREAARILMEEWSRKCGETELVIWPPECSESGGDREVTGPYSIVGRPRSAELTWINSDENIAVATLRFDAVDHRMNLLNSTGTPGSGSSSVVLTNTPPAVELDQYLATSPRVNQYYPLRVDAEFSRMFDPVLPSGSPVGSFPDVLMSPQSVDIGVGLASGWTGSVTNVDSSSGPILVGDFGDELGGIQITGQYGGNLINSDVTLSRSHSFTMGSTPILLVEIKDLSNPMVTNSLTCSFNGGSPQTPIGSFVTPRYLGRRVYAFTPPNSVTSMSLKMNQTHVVPYAGPYQPGMLVSRIFKAKSAGAVWKTLSGSPETPDGTDNLPQIAVRTSPSSFSGLVNRMGTFRASYTTGMMGWWEQQFGSTRSTIVLKDSPSYTMTPTNIVWNGTTYAFNAFLTSVRAITDRPVFYMLTWSSTNLSIWTSEDNPSYPSTPKLAQSITVTSGNPTTSGVYPSVSSGTGLISDIISGVDQYGSNNNTLAQEISDTGLGVGAPLNITDLGNVCVPLVIQFTSSSPFSNPRVADSSGDFVGANGTFAAGTVVEIRTDTGSLTSNGVTANHLLVGNPFFSVDPGETLTVVGGGNATVSWRPAVISG